MSPPFQKMITDALYLISSLEKTVRFLTTVDVELLASLKLGTIDICKNIIFFFPTLNKFTLHYIILVVSQITNNWALNMFR